MRYLAVLLLLFLLGGCQQQEDSPQPQATGAVSSAQQATGGSSFSFTPLGYGTPVQVVLTEDSLKFDSDWEARLENEEAKVYENGQLRAIGRFKREGRVQVSDSAGNLLVGVKIRDNGDFKVENPQKVMICKLKYRDDGFKVVGSDEETVLIKVKASGGKTKIKDGNEDEVDKFTGSTDPTVVTWLAIPNLRLEVRMACALLFKGTR